MQVKDLKTKIASVLILMINLASNQVLAISDCQSGEQNCWECGENCTARFDSNGKLTVSGTGEMTSYSLWGERK